MFRLLELIMSGGYDPKKELVELRESISALTEKLINWEESEIDLLSLNQVERSFPRRSAGIISGIIDSIYHEHMLSYAYKTTGGSRRKSVLYASSKKHEYFYIIDQKSIQIFVDQFFLGYLTHEGLLYGKNKRRLIARVNDLNSPLKPIVIGDKEIASLLDPVSHGKFNPRAFEYISSNISHADFLITMALAIYVIVDRTKDIRKLG